MISEGSCDTEEDWCHYAQNLALHHRNKLHFKMLILLKYYYRKHLFQFFIIFSEFLVIFAATVNKILFLNHLKCIVSKLLTKTVHLMSFKKSYAF